MRTDALRKQAEAARRRVEDWATDHYTREALRHAPWANALLIQMTQHLSPYDADPEFAMDEFYPRVDLLRQRQAWPDAEDDAVILAAMFGRDVAGVRQSLDVLTDGGLIDTQGYTNIRLLVQHGWPAEQAPADVVPLRRRRTVQVRRPAK